MDVLLYSSLNRLSSLTKMSTPVSSKECPFSFESRYSLSIHRFASLGRLCVVIATCVASIELLN